MESPEPVGSLQPMGSLRGPRLCKMAQIQPAFRCVASVGTKPRWSSSSGPGGRRADPGDAPQARHVLLRLPQHGELEALARQRGGATRPLPRHAGAAGLSGARRMSADPTDACAFSGFPMRFQAAWVSRQRRGGGNTASIVNVARACLLPAFALPSSGPPSDAAASASGVNTAPRRTCVRRRHRRVRP